MCILIFSMGNLPTCVGKSRKLRKSDFSRRILSRQLEHNNNISQQEDICEFPRSKHGKSKKKKLALFRKTFSFRKRKKVFNSIEIRNQNARDNAEYFVRNQ